MSTITKRTTLLLAALVLLASASVQAQSRGGRVAVAPRGQIYVPFYYAYDPFWYYGPFWGPYYPYPAYPVAGRSTADVKVEVVPKQTQVFVDGYYAGTADDFDGIFQRLRTTPGGHTITLYLDGYRTVTQNIYVRPDSTFKIRDTMDRLAAGEVSAPPPVPTRGPRPTTPLPTVAPTQG